MNIYLAARYGRREELCGYSQELYTIGHDVVSRWIRYDHHAFDARFSQMNDDTRKCRFGDFAEIDISDIERSDVLIAFTEQPDTTIHGASRGGRHVELGMAIALHKRVVIVGPLENAFCCLNDIVHYPDFAALKASWAQEGVVT
jgi:nucleoside 2-deoxyribosyltransferase